VVFLFFGIAVERVCFLTAELKSIREWKDGSGVGQIVVCVIRMDGVRQMGNTGWRS